MKTTLTEYLRSLGYNAFTLPTALRIGNKRALDIARGAPPTPDEVVRLATHFHQTVEDFCTAAQVDEGLSLDAVELRDQWRAGMVANSIPGRIVAARTKLGITQLEVATRAGMHQSSYALLETTTRHPRWDTLVKVARALNVQPIDLIPAESRDRYASQVGPIILKISDLPTNG